MSQKDNPTLTITLTGRAPVKIIKADWPVIANAYDDRHDGQVESQANRTWEWRMNVRQHADGRAIVYAIYKYDTCWQNEHNVSVRGGEMVQTPAEIVPVIQRVSEWMKEQTDSDEWERIGHECIAHLPAEDLSVLESPSLAQAALGLIDSLGSIDGLLQPDQRKARAKLCAELRACGMQAQVDDLDLDDEEEFYAEK